MLVKLGILPPKKAHGLNIDTGERHAPSNHLRSSRVRELCGSSGWVAHASRKVLVHNCCAAPETEQMPPLTALMFW